MMDACRQLEPSPGRTAVGRLPHQEKWAAVCLDRRLKFIRNFRHLLAENAEALAATIAQVAGRPVAEKLTSEVLPLADACRWLERRARKVLSPRVCGLTGRPLWLWGLSFEVQRMPFGTVLVLAPGNYPFFLPGVQALQALTAGNAVLLKPAPGTTEVARALRRLARLAGLQDELLTILPESVDAGRQEIARGVDKVVFTGSSSHGREVLSQLATTITPAVMELTGEDLMLVLSDGDAELAVAALKFGLRLNAGETCMAPRTIIAVRPVSTALLTLLKREGLEMVPIEQVPDEESALGRIAAASFSLGVSIFSRDEAHARALGRRIRSGFVLINDVIAATADPRMPFGGVRASGFGVTRGDEGLLEMTHPHVVAVRRGKSRPHFAEPRVTDARLFSSYIALMHGHGRRRLGALKSLFDAARFRERSQVVSW